MDDKIFTYGAHESATIKLMQEILKIQKQEFGQSILYDVGCNAGFHMVNCAPFCDRLLAFEPWDIIRKKAIRNVSINDFSNKIELFSIALSNEKNMAKYAAPKNENYGVGTLAIQENIIEYGETGGIDTNNTQLVETNRGDNIVKEKGSIPTLIKIDVEGLEKKVIQGFSDTITTKNPAIIFEFSSISKKDFSTTNALNQLFPSNYSYWGILRSRQAPALRRFNPNNKYENVLAWPNKTLPKTINNFRFKL